MRSSEAIAKEIAGLESELAALPLEGALASRSQHIVDQRKALAEAAPAADVAMTAARREVTRVWARLERSRQDALERCHAALQEDAAAFDQSLGRRFAPHWLAWNDPGWANYKAPPGGQLIDEVRIGWRAEEDLLPGETGLRLPVRIPLLAASGPILVLCDAESRETARRILRDVLVRAALSMPGAMRFCLLDELGLGEAFALSRPLPGARPASPYGMAETLDAVIADIRRINEEIVAPGGRLATIPEQERDSEPFEIIAAADFPRAFAASPGALESLLRVANGGLRAGRCVIVEVRRDEPLPREVSLANFENAFTLDCTQLDFELDEPPPAALAARLLGKAEQAGQSYGLGDWASVVRPDKLHSEKAVQRFETPLGERLKVWFGKGDRGQTVSHGLLTGRPGSGKSTLLQALVLGLAARYPPEECRIALVDMNEGAGFAALRGLAQVDSVCVQAPPALARAVVDEHRAEVRRRLDLFRQIGRGGASEFDQYRHQTDEPLPRRLLIVDEYQRLFEGNANEGFVEPLLELLRGGRAAGVHVLFASHVVTADALPREALQHVDLRIALQSETSLLTGAGVFQAEGRRLVSDLDHPGRAVINVNGGADGANHVGEVARLEAESTLGLAASLQPAGRKPSAAAVLDGRQGWRLADNPDVRRFAPTPPTPEALCALARQPETEGGLGLAGWSADDRPLPLWLGRRLATRGHALAALRRAAGQHVLQLGERAAQRLAAVASSLVGLSMMTAPDELDVVILDGTPPDLPGAGLMGIAAGLLHDRGVRVKIGGAEAVTSQLRDAADAEADDGRRRILVIAQPERLASLASDFDGFGRPPGGAPGDLRRLLKAGAQRGVHVIVTGDSLAAVGSILHRRELGPFGHRLAQGCSEAQSAALFHGPAGASVEAACGGHPFAMVYVDMLRDGAPPTLLIGYGASERADNEPTPTALRTALELAARAESSR